LPKQLRLQFTSSIGRAVVLVGILATLIGSASAQIFFSPYKDVTIDANYNTGEQQTGVTGTVEAVTSAMPNSTLTWAFASGTCGSESWAGITPAMEATNVQDFVSAGKHYVVSTGGADGTFDCPSNSGMQTFINHYYSANMAGVDYDIEGGQSQGIIDDLINSTKYAEGVYPNMRFSFTVATLGASTTGSDLNSLGDLVMSEIGRLGLGGNYYVDLMAFDYGGVSPSNCVVSGGNCDMAQSAIAAAESLHSHFGTPYNHIELCLMIGVADSGPTETLSPANVETIASWAQSVGLGGVHFWSFDRDAPSGSSSATGNGTSNPPLTYAKAFDSDFGGGAPPPPPSSFSLSDSPASLSVAQGASGSTTIKVSSSNGFNSAVSLSVSGLPAGVSASFSSGSVTPPANGSATSTLTLMADATATTGTATVTITGIGGSETTSTTVALAVTSTGSGAEGPYGGTPAAIPGTVMAENYDTGGQGVGYNVTSVNGTANSYRSDGVDLEAATAPATGDDLGWTAAGQWFRYTVNVSTAGTYKVSFLVAAESAIADAFHISNSAGANLSGAVAVPDTGLWQTWTTVTATVTLPAGTQTLTLDQDNPGWNFDSMAFASTSSSEGPFGGTPASIPGAVKAENYDTGGQGVGYNVTAVHGTDNAYRSDGVDLETATAPATGNDLGWTAAGQWFRYTVNVSTAGTYTVSFLVASPTAVADAFHLSNSSGANLSGAVAVPATGGFQTWTTVTATVTLPAGTQTLTLNQDAAGWNIDSMAFALSSGSSPSFSMSDSPGSLSVAQGSSGSSTITVSSSNGFNSAVSLSVSGLPAGVTASFSSGSVTPPSNGSATSTLTLTASSTATVGAATVTITAVSGSLTATATIALTVSSSGSGGGSVSLSPASYNFGSATPGTGTSWVTFTLTNSGSSAVTISSVTVSGPFVVSSNCGSSVAAGGSCPIYVYFAPTAAGSFTGTLTVDDNGSNSPQTSALSGTGS
jgi:Carbohydrate binding module (family 6)/Protein of unknown function (DUF1573)